MIHSTYKDTEDYINLIREYLTAGSATPVPRHLMRSNRNKANAAKRATLRKDNESKGEE